jgi:hypothetical protein
MDRDGRDPRDRRRHDRVRRRARNADGCFSGLGVETVTLLNGVHGDLPDPPPPVITQVLPPNVDSRVRRISAS